MATAAQMIDARRRAERTAAIGNMVVHVWLCAMMATTALAIAFASVKASANLAADLARGQIEAGAH